MMIAWRKIFIFVTRLFSCIPTLLLFRRLLLSGRTTNRAPITINAKAEGGRVFIYFWKSSVSSDTPRMADGSVAASVGIDIDRQNVDGADAIEMERYDPSADGWVDYPAFGTVTIEPFGTNGSSSQHYKCIRSTTLDPSVRYRLVLKREGVTLMADASGDSYATISNTGYAIATSDMGGFAIAVSFGGLLRYAVLWIVMPSVVLITMAWTVRHCGLLFGGKERSN